VTPADAFAAALNDFADVLESEYRESLKHPKHVAVLDPIRSSAKAVLGRFFRRQKSLLLKELEPALRIVATGNPNVVGEAYRDGSHLEYLMSADHVRRLREASADDARTAILAALPDGYELPDGVTVAMSADYAAALTAAVTAGYDTLAGDLEIAERTVSADVTAAYLRGRGLEELTTQLSGTTVKRLQGALADAYEAGADFDGLVDAVKDEFGDMAEGRAELVSQTAMNSAYNAGRLQLGKDLNFELKSWSCDGSQAVRNLSRQRIGRMDTA
jgi:DNA-binding transcriptional ArsR family regulator